MPYLYGSAYSPYYSSAYASPYNYGSYYGAYGGGAYGAYGSAYGAYPYSSYASSYASPYSYSRGYASPYSYYRKVGDSDMHPFGKIFCRGPPKVRRGITPRDRSRLLIFGKPCAGKAQNRVRGSHPQ